MRVSVIIPVKDDPPISAAVASVLAAKPLDVDLQLIVVDNGSLPLFRKGLELLPASVTLLDEYEPGPAAARNRGIAAATGDCVFFTDADCRVDAGWIAAGVDGLATTGADILRGTSEPVPASRQGAFIARALRRAPQPDGLPCRADTKNLCVRRRVFDHLRFDATALRAEDLLFGWDAEALGFHSVSWSGMRLEHTEEARVRDFIARRIAGGWVIRRRAAELGTTGRVRQALRSGLGRAPVVARGVSVASLLAARGLDIAAPLVPVAVGALAARALAAAGSLAGSLRYDAGIDQESPAGLAGKRA